MLVNHYRDLIAWQLADQFKNEVFRILRSHPEAWKDIRYRSQLLEAASSVASNLVEGFLRFSPGDFRRFIDYALGSLGEAEQRLNDGIRLGYINPADCTEAFRLARRCLTASVRLKRSQLLFMKHKPR